MSYLYAYDNVYLHLENMKDKCFQLPRFHTRHYIEAHTTYFCTTHICAVSFYFMFAFHVVHFPLSAFHTQQSISHQCFSHHRTRFLSCFPLFVSSCVCLLRTPTLSLSLVFSIIPRIPCIMVKLRLLPQCFSTIAQALVFSHVFARTPSSYISSTHVFGAETHAIRAHSHRRTPLRANVHSAHS